MSDSVPACPGPGSLLRLTRLLGEGLKQPLSERTDLRAARISIVLFSVFHTLAGCGGSSTSAPPPAPPAIVLSVSSASSIAEANTTVQLQATVMNSTNQSVTWTVPEPVGAGSVSASGLYSAPATIDQTTDVEITAISAADPTKSASAKITVFAGAAIAVRQVNGRGELYTIRDGVRFIPRGNDYLHFDPSMVLLLYGQVGYGRSTLNATLYDPVKTEQALANMELRGYNAVRIFLDILHVGDIGNETGTGLADKYISNLADFMTRAKAHHIFVFPIFEELPWVGGYKDFITTDLQTNFGTYNVQILTQPGVKSCQQFWTDLIRALVAAHAPMDSLLAYELMGEFYIDNSMPPMDKTSGTIQTANGTTYDLSDTTARVALQNDNMLFYAKAMRDAIRSLSPSAVVAMGFFEYNGTNPPPFPAIANSKVDFVDLHGSPDTSGTTVDQFIAGWQVNGDFRKPIIMGEYDGFTDVFPTTAQAADGLKAWQVAACSAGFSGWMLWTWDTAPNELPGLNIWSALSGNGEINQALAPVNRPNPCVN